MDQRTTRNFMAYYTTRKFNNAVKAVTTALNTPLENKKQQTKLSNKVTDVFTAINMDYSRSEGSDFRVVASHPIHFEVSRLDYNMDVCVAEITKCLDAETAEAYKILFDLYNAVMAAELPPKELSEAKKIEKEQRETTKNIEDDGFRTSFRVCVQWCHCMNDHGTRWIRYDWYQNYSRTAYANIRADIMKDRLIWEDKGMPNMSEMTSEEIQNFYA